MNSDAFVSHLRELKEARKPDCEAFVCHNSCLINAPDAFFVPNNGDLALCVLQSLQYPCVPALCDTARNIVHGLERRTAASTVSRSRLNRLCQVRVGALTHSRVVISTSVNPRGVSCPHARIAGPILEVPMDELYEWEQVQISL